MSGIIVQSGRKLHREESEHVKSVVEMCSGLSREELAYTLCEHLQWVTAGGEPKMQACKTLLEKLEARGTIRLPTKRDQPRPRPKKPRWTEETASREETTGELADVAPVALEVVARDRKALWNEYVDRYHYLGYQKPFGYRLRYFIESKRGPLGCLLVAGAAKAIAARDEWIGWTGQQRLNNLAWVVNNTRFLIFPWVRVNHLASHVLGQLARRVHKDWDERWGFRPVVMETFVDAARYPGTCYRAAGWISLGQTSGRGLARPGRTYKSTPKRIYVRPLARDFRRQLCSDMLATKRAE